MSDDPYIHPRDPEAVEYVLGTLARAEREAFQRDLDRDPGLRAAVLRWEEQLLPLAEAVPPLSPSAALWPAIERATLPAVEPASTGEVIAWPIAPDLVRLRRSRALWRAATIAASSVAAALALLVAADRFYPGAPETGLVAVVNRSGELPALIVRVDPRAGIVQVRSLAAETPAQHSLELWSIAGGRPPRSLGLVRPGATRVTVPEAERVGLDGATLAVSVEPSGGSPTGGPTGPVVYQGKLVPESP